MADKQINAKDISLDEIAEYYNGKDDDIYSEYSSLSSDNEIIEEHEDYSFVPQKTAVTEKKTSRKFVLITSAVSVTALFISFVCGFLMPKAEEDVNFALAHMYDSSEKYADAQNRVKTVEDEIEKLKKTIETHKQSILTITDYESNTGELKSQLKVLTDELDEINSTIEKKKSEEDKLDKSIKDKSNMTYALNPGIYTVGENITAGNYNINGKGILSISDSDGKLKANTTLSGNDFSAVLYNGDIVKLETKATFSPFDD